MKSKESKLTMVNYFAILSVFLFSGAGTFMNAALQTMIEALPNLSTESVRLVVAMPPLVSLPVMLFVGTIVGKKLSYRFCAVVGTALIAVGGVAPYFFYSNWMLVLFFRTLVGIGVGFLGMRNPLIIKSVPAKKQASYIGYGSAFMNLGAIIANPIVGFLARVSWRHAFLFDALAFVPLIIIILFLKEPVNDSSVETTEETVIGGTMQEDSKGFTWRTFYYIGMMFVTTCALYPMLSGLTTFMAYRGNGDTVIAGMILSAYQVAGMVIGLVIGTYMAICKKFSIAASCTLVIIGTVLMLFVSSVPALFVSVIFAGAGFNTMISIFQIYNGRVTAPGSVALGSTMILVGLQFGIFASTYFIPMCHAIFKRSTDVESALWGCLICYIVMAVIAFAGKVAPAEDY